MPSSEEVAEARRLVCEADGHFTFDVELVNNEPASITCSRCKRKWKVGEEER